MRISISRGAPRGMTGWRGYRPLTPGNYLNAPPAEYLARYGAQLAALDPAEVVQQLEAIAGDRTPVLCCFETIAKITAGARCHRHLVACWLEQNLGIEVDEVGAPAGFEPLAFWPLAAQ